MGKKFALTTMEEDFRCLGLMQESAQEASGEMDEARGKKRGPSMQRVLRRRSGTGSKFQTVKRAPMSSAMKRRKYNLDRMYRLRHASDIQKSQRRYAKSARGKKMRKTYKPKNEGMSRIANLLESVQSVVSRIDGRERQEYIAGFANIALIANHLSEGFESLSAKHTDYADLARAFDSMASDVAEVATGLDEGSIVVNDDVIGAFQEELEDLMAGLEVYSDLVESSEQTEQRKGKCKRKGKAEEMDVEMDDEEMDGEMGDEEYDDEEYDDEEYEEDVDDDSDEDGLDEDEEEGTSDEELDEDDDDADDEDYEDEDDHEKN